MGQKYRQFSVEERCEISRLSAAGASIRQITAALDRAPSSVARELKRNSGVQVGYQPSYAQQQARARRWSGSRLDRDANLRHSVLVQLQARWSPEQIAGRSQVLSHETIYRFIYAQIDRHNDFSWRHYLPRGRAKRGWRGQRGGSPALHMKQRVPLSERPAEVLDRAIAGHWEADLMAFARYGHNLIMLHERSSRILIVDRLSTKQADGVVAAIAMTLAPLPRPLTKTMTFDNGTEFARHYRLAELGIGTYFCDPHAPWQKGGIENAIGRMRRFLPRKTDLATLAIDTLIDIVTAYNNTPRKCLDWKTPAEAFSKHLLHFGCESTYRPSRGRHRVLHGAVREDPSPVSSG